MTVSHYVEFVSDDKYASIGHCVSRLMTMLHGLMRHTQVNLGVSFPNMTEDFIGDKVRIFGSQEQLMTVLSNPQIQDACRRSVCSLSVYIPTLIPENAKAVRYITVRNTGLNVNALYERKLARFVRRHGEPMPKEEQKKLKLHLANKAQNLPYFTIKHEQGLYPIYVCKQLVGEENGGFNSHGLGNQGGTVYEF